jgi:hypothetical protein
VQSHHHGQDGIMINGDHTRSTRSRFENVITEYNARQGVSLVGGRGYDFLRCKFNNTGRSVIASAPAAGVDIEAEGTKLNRDFTFEDCEFSNNVGCGLLADAGDSEEATFKRCKFIGTTSWSAWPHKPRFSFEDCTFVGTLVHPFPHEDPGQAAQFHDCRFRDDPTLSPNGRIYFAGNRQHAIVDMAESHNVFFNRCLFRLTHDGLMPWSWRAIYSDCTMTQTAKKVAFPRGMYLGYNTISGPADMYNSKILGTLLLNGKTVPKGLNGGLPW